jgi:general secretion pathway protein D
MTPIDSHNTPTRATLSALALSTCLALGAMPWPLHAQGRASEPVVLNFVEADIEAVARTMATITGRNVVVDPRVKGTINLATERPVAPLQR